MYEIVNPRKRTLYDWILEVFAFVALIWTFIPLLSYESLPVDIRIPTHYNMFGQVDGWGSRFDLWILLSITVLFYILFSVLERYPKWLNLSIKVTPENTNVIHRLAVRLLRHLKLILTVMFACMINLSLAIAIGKGVGIYNSFMPALPSVLLVTLIVYMVKIRRARHGR